MGGNVADYLVVQDNQFNLVVAADLDRTFGPFSLPGDTITNQRSILSFMVVNAQNGRLDVHINGHRVMQNFGLGSTDVKRCVQEACPPDILRNGSGNTVKFALTSGSCTLSDVVVWFQNAT